MSEPSKLTPLMKCDINRIIMFRNGLIKFWKKYASLFGRTIPMRPLHRYLHLPDQPSTGSRSPTKITITILSLYADSYP